MAFCDVPVFLLTATRAPVAITGLCHQEDCPSSSFLSPCSPCLSARSSNHWPLGSLDFTEMYVHTAQDWKGPLEVVGASVVLLVFHHFHVHLLISL